MADHGDEITVAADLDAQDAEAVLGIVEGDALDETGQRLPFGAGRVRAQGGASGGISHGRSVSAWTWNEQRTFLPSPPEIHNVNRSAEPHTLKPIILWTPEALVPLR